MYAKLRLLLEKEATRQQNTLDLIASENITSLSVRKAVGSQFMHKYAEGYPGERYYEGNEIIDELELLCKSLVLDVFGLKDTEWHANVQPLSGSVANLAVFNAALEIGDTILSMYLPDGGHLSHGWSYVKAASQKKKTTDERVYYGGDKKVSVVSKLYNVIQYKTDPETGRFDYDFIEKLAKKEKPKLIITGGTAYPRAIDYKRVREIADSVDALYLADVAHEAGLIAGGAVSSPFPYADIVTFTTHKTLRGPRGAVIIAKKKLGKKIDSSVFPGMQGGPFEHTIAGLTQALFEASEEEFKTYAGQVVKNAKRMAVEFMKKDYTLVSGGTDKHLVLIDLREKGIGGKYAARALAYGGIISNKNTTPYDTGSPVNPSGIRLGTPSITTRGMIEEDIDTVVELIDKVIVEASKHVELSFEEFDELMKESDVIAGIKKEVEGICKEFPID